LNRLILDTEFVGLGKPFVYNLGYVIVDKDFKVLHKADYVVKQIWNNKELFATSYYATKKNLYVRDMRARKMSLKYWGHIVNALIKDINKFDVREIWAYNNRADIRAIEFMCEWFKSKNPLHHAFQRDILARAKETYPKASVYVDWCVEHQKLTKSGKPKCDAETVYGFIKQDADYKESHTALDDCLIEMAILYDMIGE
jgi:hypothetical protein